VVLNLRQEKLVEAEKVFRYALTRHPRAPRSIASWASDVPQQFADEAVLMFKKR